MTQVLVTIARTSYFRPLLRSVRKRQELTTQPSRIDILKVQARHLENEAPGPVNSASKQSLLGGKKSSASLSLTPGSSKDNLSATEAEPQNTDIPNDSLDQVPADMSDDKSPHRSLSLSTEEQLSIEPDDSSSNPSGRELPERPDTPLEMIDSREDDFTSVTDDSKASISSIKEPRAALTTGNLPTIVATSPSWGQDRDDSRQSSAGQIMMSDEQNRYRVASISR